MKIFNQLGYKVLDIEVDDNSYRQRVIMGEHSLTLYYSLPEHVELPVGSYCQFQGETFTLERPEAFKMKHSRYFEYTVTMEAPEAKAKIWKFRNTVDGRLKFSLTAKPVEHLQMFVDNMNRRDKGWTVGDCIDGVEQCINYDHAFCLDALKQQASEFKTEYEFKGKRVSLKKVEYNKTYPLPLSYGRGNGFKSGVGRTNTGEQPPVEILYVQGGTDNLDPSKYGASELRLPKSQQLGFDGEHFDTEDGFNQDSSRLYITDEDGLSIRRYDKQLASLAEDSLDCSSISPKRVGEVSKVITVDAETNFYDFTDTTIPETLNFEDCLIEGETMTVIFQTGMLAGREFEVKYYHEAKTVRGVKKEARRFELVPQEIDGQTMPNETFKPREGDTYAVFNCMMPDAYICDNKTKTGASWDMFREAVKYLFDNEDTKLTFTGELDGIWAKKDWLNIGGRIVLGGFIRFTDPRFQPDPVLVRITGIKDYINKPYSPVIELSNTTVSGSVSSTLKELQSQEVLIEDNQRAALQFTKRRFRDARETIAMLEASLLDNFTGSISPIAVQTMSLLVGDESLQFRFVSSRTNPVQVAHAITWDNEQKQLTAEAGIIQHMTLGISSLSSSHDTSEYRFWDVEEYMSGRIEEGEKKFYLYAKVSETGQTGSFLLSETAIKMGQVSGFYHLLVGVLNSEYDGERSFVTLYGFTEVLPGRVTTDRVVSGDGQSYFDMIANALKLGNKLSFNTQGDGLLRLRGTLVQNEGGDESYIGCYRGVWNAAYVYYNGDEVTFTANGLTSTYRYVYATPSRGVVPTNPTYWQILAEGQKGDKGDKGDDGADGIDGVNGSSPVMVYRGVYDSSKTYYGNANRLDCVKSGDTYYIARIDAGTFSNVAPPNTNKWNSFGASFESVATNLLLAENANIGDWFMSGGKIVSTLSSGDIIELDAKNNRIYIKSATSGGDYAVETGLGSQIELNAATGIIEARSNGSTSAVSYMSPSGIFANRAGTRCVAASSGLDQRAAICGLGYGNLNKTEWDTGETTLLAAVYGYASNSGTAPAFGGYFFNLKANGLTLGIKKIFGTSTSTTYLTDAQTLVVGLSSVKQNVYLPASDKQGQTIILKQLWTGYMRVYPRSGYKLFDDSTENEYYDVGQGQCLIAHFVKFSINGEIVSVWTLSRFKY